MHKERFFVEWSMEGFVEILLPPDADEKDITEAARNAVINTMRAGEIPSEKIDIDRYNGPY